MKYLRASLALCTFAGLASMAVGHGDDRKLADRIGPYEGSGWTADSRGSQPDFDSSGIELLSWLTLSDLSGGSDGSDCWGYVSPSGREYALFGHFSGTTFVDITVPTSPVVLENVAGPTSIWRDIKVFDEYAYIVSEGGSGVQVVDLTQIDSGQVTFIDMVNDTGTSATHNVAINTDSGFLYRCGGGSNGLRMYDLSDPDSPQFAGWWTDRYVHDAQIVTMQSGPFAGREIAFCCSGFNGGFTETGLDIVDVTDKDNPVNLGRVQYPSAEFSHQVWLPEDEQTVYLNDELDESNQGVNSGTIIIDVSDLTDPTFVERVTNGSNAITHNNYVRGDMLFAANYQSGLRVFDITEPSEIQEIAFFDTFPGGDSASFNGLWSIFPFFPSGTIIGSDIERGLFVWRSQITPIEFDFPAGVPEFINTQSPGIEFSVSSVFGGEVDPQTVELNIRQLGEQDFQTVPATNVSGDTFVANIAGIPCGATAEFFLAAQTTDGTTVTDPIGAPGQVFTAQIITQETTAFFDNMETDTGWTVGAPTDTATTGIWERVDPVGTDAQPGNDASETGTRAWITGQGVPGGGLGDNDVDGGATTLISPSLDATDGDGVAFISYERWYSNDQGAAPNADTFFVDISDDGGETWVNIESINQNPGAWVEKSFRIDQFVTPTSDVRVRFVASDFGNGSIVEAGVDDVEISVLGCSSVCPGDCDNDGAVNFSDLVTMLGEFGTAGSNPGCDIDESGTVNFSDLVATLGLFGPCN